MDAEFDESKSGKKLSVKANVKASKASAKALGESLKTEVKATRVKIKAARSTDAVFVEPKLEKGEHRASNHIFNTAHNHIFHENY